MKAEEPYYATSYLTAIYLTARGFMPYGAEGKPGGPVKYRFPGSVRAALPDLKAVRGILDNMAALASDPADDVTAWLQDMLKDGRRTAEEIYDGARAKGFTKREVHSAREVVGVCLHHPAPLDPWYWQLECDSCKEAGR